MATPLIDFQAVKRAVSIEAALNHYGVKLYRVNRAHVRGRCPLPTHTSDTSKVSFIANTEKNVWSCKSASCVAARKGRSGGNVLDFVTLMEGCSLREAAEKLATWFGVDAHLPVAPKPAAPRPEKPTAPPAATPAPETPAPETQGAGNSPLKFTLRGITASHPYLAQRGITDATAAVFGVGFFPGKGSMVGRVVIPIENESGELVAYAGRAVGGEEPKYKLPAGFQKSLVLFNLARALKAPDPKRVVVVEGFFDAMKVHQGGYPCVVALMGSALTETQEKLLVANFREVVLLLDGDGAGRNAAADALSRLARKAFVRVVDLAEGRQPDQLSGDEVRALLASCA